MCCADRRKKRDAHHFLKQTVYPSQRTIGGGKPLTNLSANGNLMAVTQECGDARQVAGISAERPAKGEERLDGVANEQQFETAKCVDPELRIAEFPRQSFAKCRVY